MPGFMYENAKGQFEIVEVGAEGVWCVKCRFFEQDISVEDIHAEGRCNSCGCGPDNHENASITWVGH